MTLYLKTNLAGLQAYTHRPCFIHLWFNAFYWFSATF